MLKRMLLVFSGFVLGLMLLIGCATTPNAPAKPMPAPKQSAAAAKKPAQKAVGPATRKVQVRQAEIEDEFDFTLGEPLDPAVRKRIDAESRRASK